MSSALSQSFAPFLIRSWQPLLRGESIRPGTAKTCRPQSVAMLAVISAPLVKFAPATTGGGVGFERRAPVQIRVDPPAPQEDPRHNPVADREGLAVRRAVERE